MNGKDKVFKVSSVCMLDQYRLALRQQRGVFNYAVLRIEGENNFEDEFGVIGIHLGH